MSNSLWRLAPAALALAFLAGPILGQAAPDSGFSAMQARGQQVMGVDQYSSHHVFEDLPDGGRIILVRDDPTDSLGVATIRAHLRSIAVAFAQGDFSDPEQVHAHEVPGTRTMALLKDRIHYAASDRPGGGQLRISSSDTAAVAAIHDFLAFQRSDHHAAGHEGMEHRP
ncbi:MAG TPA: hypothetical protein VMG41_01845 [Gemmatimonadales bacterium]|nr:hypothetical protein [Gemmatimonadales bacterium]